MFNDIKVLHLEPTTVCNATCPQCSRENPSLYDKKTHQSELSLKHCKTLFNKPFIKNLNKMFMCGNFGDPSSAQDAYEIFQYFRTINPEISLGMNTNGSIRSTKWWHKLGKLFNSNLDYVVFSIDGLEDTHSIYRRKTNYKKILDNAKSYINAGGSAHLEMLLFEHNQHQLDDVINLAKEYNFSWFKAKVSKRFTFLESELVKPPTNYIVPSKDNTEIKCHALEEQSVYVSATGEILPCCWIGNYVFNKDEKLKKLLFKWNWEKIKNSWVSDPHYICQENCGVKENITTFESQWVMNLEL